jgi:hypothetical protein
MSQRRLSLAFILALAIASCGGTTSTGGGIDSGSEGVGKSMPDASTDTRLDDGKAPDARAPHDSATTDSPTDASTCLGVGQSCTPADCCGVDLACVSGNCSTDCAAYGHPCSAAMPCCMAPRPNVEVCNSLGYCQTE